MGAADVEMKDARDDGCDSEMVTMDCKNEGSDHLANMGSKGRSDILYSQCAVPSEKYSAS